MDTKEWLYKPLKTKRLKMHLYTDQQIKERQWLEEAVSTVTKIEPKQWADLIHKEICFSIRKGRNSNEILNSLEAALDYMCVQTCSGGNNFEGWRDRKVYLSKKQQAIILKWIKFTLMLGGQFHEKAD